MKRDRSIEARDAAMRTMIAEELAASLRRLAHDMPTVPADVFLRMAIGYLAGVYAQSFGHAATVRALITITRRGVQSAAEELAARDEEAAANPQRIEK